MTVNTNLCSWHDHAGMLCSPPSGSSLLTGRITQGCSDYAKQQAIPHRHSPAEEQVSGVGQGRVRFVLAAHWLVIMARLESSLLRRRSVPYG